MFNIDYESMAKIIYSQYIGRKCILCEKRFDNEDSLTGATWYGVGGIVHRECFDKPENNWKTSIVKQIEQYDKAFLDKSAFLYYADAKSISAAEILDSFCSDIGCTWEFEGLSVLIRRKK